MSAATPGQAAYEVWRAAVPDFVCNVPGGKWEDLPETIRAGFDAIAAQEPHAAPELQAVESVYLYHWRFDRGEEYGLFRDKADAEAAAEARRAEYPGEGLFEVLGMAILGRPEPKPAPELAAAVRAARDGERERIRQLAIDYHAMTVSQTERMMPFEEMLRRSPEGNAAALLTVVSGTGETPADAMAARLAAAEAVCVLFGWTAARLDGDREKALHELWRHWTEVSGVSLDPGDHPELSDAVIAELAARRDETRRRTLAAIHGDQTGGDQ